MDAQSNMVPNAEGKDSCPDYSKEPDGQSVDYRNESFPSRTAENTNLIEKGDKARETYARALAASIGQEAGYIRHFDCDLRPDFIGSAMRPNGVPRRYSFLAMKYGWCEVFEEDADAFSVKMAGPDRAVNVELSRRYERAELETLAAKYRAETDSPTPLIEQYTRELQRVADIELAEEYVQLIRSLPVVPGLPFLFVPESEEAARKHVRLEAVTKELASRAEHIAEEAVWRDARTARAFFQHEARDCLRKTSWLHPILKLDCIRLLRRWNQIDRAEIVSAWREVSAKYLELPEFHRAGFACKLTRLRAKAENDDNKNGELKQ